MTKTLQLGDFSRDGLLQVMDTSAEEHGITRVTVREMIGGISSWSLPASAVYARMRRLAKRTADYPTTARLMRTFTSGGCSYATFELSRNN